MTEYTVQQTVGAGCTELLLSVRIPLPRPSWEVTAVQKTVLIDRADATLGSVLLQGRLRACYTVTGVPLPSPPPPLGRPPAPWTAAAICHAPLQAVWAETPFTAAIAVPGAEPAFALTVTAAHVTDQALHPALVEASGAMAALDDQSLLQIAVRLSRAQAVTPEAAAQAAPPHRTPPAFTRFQSPRRT